ncbi:MULTISPECIES: hypothetical protein [Streptomyces]|uniref:Uncharacterized protein n=1 Tax=Streptomyces venezuelae (strain ATCC 10712 / CBS 650.69 / DSM 40230 / JCM 4526 / NBRC 13096 / PD 04745) TaxID=953739 RepID=F2R2A0_STRVP|nr:hypothetical protein [Streptomyces venezuelae]APE21598.1 hypothetical protein vnz_11565 [Streptomyces venezuelae]QER98981.1 hypothetical protein DEJ43_11710 [Streptomyces venezuelae ATCC 10712]CCA55649.1 hypothetical protein SVEN_2363 [Streptomyces venezuelae ATCC 10712]
MPDTAETTDFLLAAAAQEGLGDTLRLVLLVSIVGGVLVAWFLLRGYRADDTGADGRGGGDGRDGADGTAGIDTDRDANA